MNLFLEYNEVSIVSSLLWKCTLLVDFKKSSLMTVMDCFVINYSPILNDKSILSTWPSVYSILQKLFAVSFKFLVGGAKCSDVVNLGETPQTCQTVQEVVVVVVVIDTLHIQSIAAKYKSCMMKRFWKGCVKASVVMKIILNTCEILYRENRTTMFCISR